MLGILKLSVLWNVSCDIGHNLRTSYISVSITVTVLERANEQRSKRTVGKHVLFNAPGSQELADRTLYRLAQQISLRIGWSWTSKTRDESARLTCFQREKGMFGGDLLRKFNYLSDRKRHSVKILLIGERIWRIDRN